MFNCDECYAAKEEVIKYFKIAINEDNTRSMNIYAVMLIEWEYCTVNEEDILINNHAKYNFIQKCHILIKLFIMFII